MLGVADHSRLVAVVAVAVVVVVSAVAAVAVAAVVAAACEYGMGAWEGDLWHHWGGAFYKTEGSQWQTALIDCALDCAIDCETVRPSPSPPASPSPSRPLYLP